VFGAPLVLLEAGESSPLRAAASQAHIKPQPALPVRRTRGGAPLRQKGQRRPATRRRRWRSATSDYGMLACSAALRILAALLVPPSAWAQEEAAGSLVTLLTDETFDAFIHEHEFSMIEL